VDDFQLIGDELRPSIGSGGKGVVTFRVMQHSRRRHHEEDSFCNRNRTRGRASSLVTDRRQRCKEESVRWHLGAGLRTAAPQRRTGYQDNFGRTLYFCRLRYEERKAALYRGWNLHSEWKLLHRTHRLCER